MGYAKYEYNQNNIYFFSFFFLYVILITNRLNLSMNLLCWNYNFSASYYPFDAKWIKWHKLRQLNYFLYL